MKKMSKQDVETVIFENAKTGEALEFQHEQHKAEYGAKHFWKADKKFFELLSTFSAAESKVVAYILQKTQPTKNEFIGAYKTIARKLECDVTTVRNTFKKMMENDMLAKTDDERIWITTSLADKKPCGSCANSAFIGPQSIRLGAQKLSPYSCRRVCLAQ